MSSLKSPFSRGLAAWGSVLIPLVALTLVSLASATTLHTSQSTFNAASQSLTTLDFNGLVTSPEGFASLGSDEEIGGVTFAVPSFLAAVNGNFSLGYEYGIGTVLTSFGSPGDFTQSDNSFDITLPSDVTAVGFYLANSFAGVGLPGDFTFQLSTGETFTAAATPGAAQFYGFTSSESIGTILVINNTDPASYASITAPDGSPFTNLGQFQFGVAATSVSVAEPETWVILLITLAMLGLGRQRMPPKGKWVSIAVSTAHSAT